MTISPIPTKLLDNQLFATGRDKSTRGLRYAVWHTVEFRGDEPHDKCIIIDFKSFTEYRAWIEAGEPATISISSTNRVSFEKPSISKVAKPIFVPT